RRSRTPVIILGGVVIIAFLGIGAWLLSDTFMSTPTPVLVQPAALKPVIIPPTTSAAPVVVAPVPAVTAAAQPTQQIVQLPVVLPTNIEVKIPIIPTVAIPTSRTPAEVTSPAAPAVWPLLKVNMLLKTSKTAVAKINNSELSVGDEIEGVQIIAIESDAVTLKFKGVIRKVRAGGITQ
ncbi:MAG: hypothetical protein WCN95_13985, partial [bacterium]